MGIKLPDYQEKRLLLVEDNELNMEIFEEFLNFTKINVEKAYNGAQAVDMIARSNEYYYDVVLSDIRMRDMDGYLMAKSIRGMKREDTKEMPIIGMTADTLQCSLEEAMLAGMNAQIYKPFGVMELVEVLKDVLVI